MPRNPLASTIFTNEDSPTMRKLRMCPCSTFIIKQWYQKATGYQTMLGYEPPTRCHHSNNGGKKDMVLMHLPCSKNQEHPCIFLTRLGRRQVSNSWHTEDRFFLHKRKEKVTTCFYHCNSNEFLSKHI